MTLYTPPRMLIGGEWTTGPGGGREVVNPATEEVLANLPNADGAILDKALASAQKGFLAWRAMSAEKRCEIVLEGCRLLRERIDAIAPLITIEQGKPLAEARQEVLRAASILEWDANEGRRAYGTIVPSEEGYTRFGIRLPIGPVAAFTPWNFPISSPARKIGAALGAGCSIIVKGAEDTPAALSALAECLLDGGLPPDVLNIVFGEPATISEHLIASPVIRAVTFTGSIPVGKHLAGLAAAHMKPVVMELGGHSPVIVCEDVDVEAVARLGVDAKFRNAGQICTSPTRFIVQGDVHDAFVETFVELARKITVADGMEKGTRMGPVASGRRLNALEAVVRDAADKGARIATGGQRKGNRGYYFEPTVITNPPEAADVVTVEPFGPIAPVIRFERLDEAIAIANRLPYGLCSYAFTNSQSATYRLIHGVESGIMSINHFGTSQADTPFGGVKESGYGREGGYESLDAFMVTKFVSQKIEV